MDAVKKWIRRKCKQDPGLDALSNCPSGERSFQCSKIHKKKRNEIRKKGLLPLDQLLNAPLLRNQHFVSLIFSSPGPFAVTWHSSSVCCHSSKTFSKIFSKTTRPIVFKLGLTIILRSKDHP